MSMRFDLDFDFGGGGARRRPSLTPMIDVVFLLLVFFMLAARFGADLAAPLPLVSAAGGGYSGPPRLVSIGPDAVSLNGAAIDEASLAAALAPLTTSPRDMIVLRGLEGADLQRVIDVAERLTAAGFGALVLAE